MIPLQNRHMRCEMMQPGIERGSRLSSGYILLGCLVAMAPLSEAGDGTWIAETGDWDVPGNWQDGNIADGTDATANFLSIPANRTVTADAGRTIGHMRFGDDAGSGDNWSLDGGPVTLETSAGMPTIASRIGLENSGILSIYAELQGDDGLKYTKETTHRAEINLRKTPTYSGGTVIDGVNLNLWVDAGAPFGSGPLSLVDGEIKTKPYTVDNAVSLDGDFTFSSSGSTYQGGITFTQPAVLTGNRTLTLNAYSYDERGVYVFEQGIGDGGNNYSLTLTTTEPLNTVLQCNVKNTYTGPTLIHGGTLEIRDRIDTTTPYVELNVTRNGSLSAGQLTAYSDGDNDTIADNLPIYMQGGRLVLRGPNMMDPVETVGTVTVRPSASEFEAYPYRGVTQLTISDLVRDSRATFFFYGGQNLGHTGPLGGTTGNRGHIYITGQGNGYMGGWATAVQYTDTGYRDFATYSDARGVEILGTSVTRPAQVEGAAGGSHVLTTAAQNPLTGNASIASLVVQAGGNNDLGGFELDLTGGGLLAATAYTVSNGDVTSSAGALYLTALAGMTVSADLVGAMDVIVTGTMTFSGVGNTASGELCVNSGTLTLDTANGFSTVTVAPTATVVVNDTDALGPTTCSLYLLRSNPCGMLDLQADVTVQVLSLDGVAQPAGDYNETGAGGATALPDWLTGPGTLTVEPAAAGTVFLIK